MSSYEITFIVRPDLDDDGVRGAVEAVRRRIEAGEGKILSAFPWGPGRRRMAYPIRNFNDGYYYTMTFDVTADALRGIESSLRLNDNLLRFLVVSATQQMLRNAEQRQHQQAQAATQPAAQPVPVGAAAGTSPVPRSEATPVPGISAEEPPITVIAEPAPEAEAFEPSEEATDLGAHPVVEEGE